MLKHKIERKKKPKQEKDKKTTIKRMSTIFDIKTKQNEMKMKYIKKSKTKKKQSKERGS
jgi:hypothetical protein